MSLQKNYLPFLIFCATLILVSACIDVDPNANPEGESILEEYKAEHVTEKLGYRDTFYVPVYSDIYIENKHELTQLTATLSIRSTSFMDTMYIFDILYYNTKGELVNSLLEDPLQLSPMQSFDYVVDRENDQGGVGANFIVIWGASRNLKPIMQTVMISTFGQHGLSFLADGKSIKQ